ncbi:MAG: lysozyme inhibitor LprI family protein [Eubacteriales bacterium]|nr:lysozyme inhibitor LprI family protein [Eubacteriales bacterium]
MRKKKAYIFSAAFAAHLVIMTASGVMAAEVPALPGTGNEKYDAIIRKYIEGINCQWDMNQFAENGLNYLTGYTSSLDEMGYCLLDLDQNGVDELLIGCVNDEDYVGMFYDLYTFAGKEPVLLASSSERDRYYLCEDYTIANEGSGSAQTSAFGYYLLDGSELTLKEAVMYDGDYDAQNPWFYSTENSWEDHRYPIEEYVADGIRKKYEHTAIPFQPFSGEKIDDVADGGSDNISELKQQAISEVMAVEAAAEEIETRLETGLLDQNELNQCAGQLYQLWDDELNILWSYLKQSLPQEEMAVLTEEEVQWIADKENQVNQAGSEWEGGSMQPMIEASTAASITQDRVYELLERIP